MTLALSGHGVVGGIAVGQTHIMRRNELDIGEYRIDRQRVASETQRLDHALEAARDHLRSLAQRVHDSAGRAAEEIINTHIAMLSDSSLYETVNQYIRDDLCNAEWALQRYLEGLLADINRINDDYIRSRGEDAMQVVQMVQKTLGEEVHGESLEELPDRLGQTLVVASELTPGELATLHERGVAGVVTEHGSPHSHTAILARNLGVPTVMGVHHGQSLIREGEQAVMDGHYGIVFADPEESILKHYLQKQTESKRFIKSLEKVRSLEPVSMDGTDIRLLANAERLEDMRVAARAGAQGVGLFRTEFLFLGGHPPDEEAQYKKYRDAIDVVGDGVLTIRTLDLGADKGADLLDFEHLRSSQNPALGLRAVRLCLREMDVFRTQLRAILRASAHGNVQCLIPMLTSASEIEAVKSLLHETCETMTRQGIAFNPELPLGGMIEVPAAALALESLGRELDFLSVGTNDLIQYALATDRVDEQVTHLYDPQHPGVINLLTHIFKSAQRIDAPLSVCGELAGDRRYTRFLLALGLTEFSMAPRYLLEVKQVIRETHIENARRALDEWMSDPDLQSRASLVHHLDRSQG